MMKISKLGRKIHKKLQGKLKKLTLNVNRGTLPKIVWVTENIGNNEYLQHLTSLKESYGIEDIKDSKKVDNIDIDCIPKDKGKGLLPYTNLEEIIGKVKEIKDKEVLYLKIDRFSFEGDLLFSWCNVFGVSFAILGKTSEWEKIWNEYLNVCFGINKEKIKGLLENLSKLIKDICIFKGLKIFREGNFPDSVEWFDVQVEDNQLVGFERPTREVIVNTDMEFIELMERFHNLWDQLEADRKRLCSEEFLWIENGMQKLKTVMITIRQLILLYLTYRGVMRKTIDIPEHILKAKCYDLKSILRRNYLVLSEFDRCYPNVDVLSLHRFANQILVRANECLYGG